MDRQAFLHFIRNYFWLTLIDELSLCLSLVVLWEVELVKVSRHFLGRLLTWLLCKSEQAVQACIPSLDSISLVLGFESLHALIQPLSYEVKVLTTDLALRHGYFSLNLLHDLLGLTCICRQGTQRAESPRSYLKWLRSCEEHEGVKDVVDFGSLFRLLKD